MQQKTLIDLQNAVVAYVQAQDNIENGKSYLLEIAYCQWPLGHSLSKPEISEMITKTKFHEAALKAVNTLMNLDPECGSPSGNLLRGLSKAVARYENETLPPPLGNADAK